jgi:hypothetical protein
MMMTPNSDAPKSLKALEYAEFRRTLPLLLPTGPKFSDATLRKENISHTKKYT